MKKIKSLLNLELLFYLVLTFLFIVNFFIALNFSFNSYISFDNLYIFIPVMVVFLLCFYFIFKYIQIPEEKSFKFYLLIIIGIALIIKIINLLLIAPSVTQISDFAVHLNNAIATTPTFANTVHFYHWALLSETFKIFTSIFGATQYGGILFISIISVINIILLFVLSKLITKNNKYAFIIAFIYSIWPANIFYVNLFSTEHLAITFILLITILFIIFNNNHNMKQNIYSYILLSFIIYI